MSELADGSVQMVCCSPPYWGLRKYSGEQELIWGGDKDCEHQGQTITNKNPLDRGGKGQFDGDAIGTNMGAEITMLPVTSSFCSLCGAWKGAYGLEPTPEMYIEHTIEILREIRRVLRKDGVVFWNCGDSYYGSGGDHKEGGKNDAGFQGDLMRGVQAKQQRHNLLKPKDLCLIPFRVAIAAQEDGWWVRSVIIWSKPNPMPESVTDRPTESHEYILMLTKSGTTQYWTHRDGNRESPNPNYRWVKDGVEADKIPEGWTPKNKMGWNRINLWRGHDYFWDADAVREPNTQGTIERGQYQQGTKAHSKRLDDKTPDMWLSDIQLSGRNLRTVWEFPTQPYPEAHFAVFPEKLPELCIKAATPEVGCCSKCGAPWERILDKKPSEFNIRVRDAKAGRVTSEEGYKATQKEVNGYPGNHPDPGYRQTIGWQPTCKCNADKVSSLVLDPFMGAGTTLWVAKKLNRQAIGYEISQEYCELALDRNRQQVLI